MGKILQGLVDTKCTKQQYAICLLWCRIQIKVNKANDFSISKIHLFYSLFTAKCGWNIRIDSIKYVEFNFNIALTYSLLLSKSFFVLIHPNLRFHIVYGLCACKTPIIPSVLKHCTIDVSAVRGNSRWHQTQLPDTLCLLCPHSPSLGLWGKHLYAGFWRGIQYLVWCYLGTVRFYQ